MNRIKTLFLPFMAITALAFGAVTVVPNNNAMAGECDGKSAKECIKTGWTKAGGKSTDTLTGSTGLITKIINAMLFIIGALAVIMIIWSGIRMVISNGNATTIENAKKTLIYAVAGLIVAILAYAIVNFVIAQF